jgi:hypothetical protein
MKKHKAAVAQVPLPGVTYHTPHGHGLLPLHVSQVQPLLWGTVMWEPGCLSPQCGWGSGFVFRESCALCSHPLS